MHQRGEMYRYVDHGGERRDKLAKDMLVDLPVQVTFSYGAGSDCCNDDDDINTDIQELY